MKKIFIALVAIGMIFSIPVFAFNDPPVEEVTKSFAKHFPGVNVLRWETIGEDKIHRASFRYLDRDVRAYFSVEGKLIATTRNSEFSHLPYPVQNTINTNYSHFTIKNIWEYVTETYLTYYIELKNDKKILLVNIDPGGEADVFKKTNLK